MPHVCLHTSDTRPHALNTINETHQHAGPCTSVLHMGALFCFVYWHSVNIYIALIASTLDVINKLAYGFSHRFKLVHAWDTTILVLK